MPKKTSDKLLDEVTHDFRQVVESVVEGFDDAGKVRILTAIQSRMHECSSMVHKTVFETSQSGSFFQEETPKEHDILLTRLDDLPWACNKTISGKIIQALNAVGIEYVYEVVKARESLTDIPGFYVRGLQHLKAAIKKAGIDMSTAHIPYGHRIQLEREIKRRKLL
jgi:hypothetical protein